MELRGQSRSQMEFGNEKNKKISESGESGEWDSLVGFRWNLRKMEMKLILEMKLAVMPRSCHEFGQGVSLANPA